MLHFENHDVGFFDAVRTLASFSKRPIVLTAETMTAELHRLLVQCKCTHNVVLFQRPIVPSKAWSMKLLGERYRDGIGVPKDANKAFELFTTAVEQDYVSAFQNLGAMYCNGCGTSLKLPVLGRRKNAAYETEKAWVYEPLRSREKIQIIKAIIDKEFDLNVFKHGEIVLVHLHERIKTTIVYKLCNRSNIRQWRSILLALSCW